MSRSSTPEMELYRLKALVIPSGIAQPLRARVSEVMPVLDPDALVILVGLLEFRHHHLDSDTSFCLWFSGPPTRVIEQAIAIVRNSRLALMVAVDCDWLDDPEIEGRSNPALGLFSRL